MKCVILAGGSGDALWPLSRKNYPKQFMNIREGRSLFQEAVARNLPFCDEFIIITNDKYRYVVEGQLQAFQGLSYQLFLEELGRATAPAVAIAAMCVDKEEDVLVVSTDHLIDDGDYNKTIVGAKELLTDDNIVVVGCSKENVAGSDITKGHSAFVCEGSFVSAFIEKCDSSVLSGDSDVLLDSGIFMMRAKTYLKAIEENAPELYRNCLEGNNRIRVENGAFVITKEWLLSIPSTSVGAAVFTKWAGKNVYAAPAQFVWSRLLDIESVTQFEVSSMTGPYLTENCSNVSILNENKDKLVVVNGCDDLVIVNTKDAAYISKKGDSASIRTIMNEHYDEYKDIFDEGDVFYTSWGIKETLTKSEGYTVKKITLFPGRNISMHKHEQRSEHWSIVSGVATITMNGTTAEYDQKDSIFVPVDTFHKIANETASDLIFIEVSVGMSAGKISGDTVKALDDFVKVGPVYKDYLWGGTRLYDIFGKDNPGNPDHMIAESWEISAHSAGVSVITEGNAKGMLFSDYLNKIGKDAWGWKCKPFERFPLLIKFIDATNALSVQVHPDDNYAMSVEGDYGKNEMWYVMDAAENAGLYIGFKEEISAKECKKHIEDGTLTDVLKRVPVKKGDVIFVKAGTVHAILEGLLILEIQQSSNATYRLYDYDRVDKNGCKRELHLEKALENMDFKPYDCKKTPEGEKESFKGYTKQLLGECKYFASTLYEVCEHAEISLDDTSFSAIVFLSGKGSIETENQHSDFVAGDSYFVPAGKKVLRIDGECQFVLSKI